jgi:hypothetical protein
MAIELTVINTVTTGRAIWIISEQSIGITATISLLSFISQLALWFYLLRNSQKSR